MGLFSGGFFGGGTDESSSSTTTTTTTNTTNTTRDIGVTGKDAVLLASTLANAGTRIGQQAVSMASIDAGRDRVFTTGLFDFAKTLVSGNEQTMRMQKEYEGKFVQYQDQQVQKVLQSGFAMANPDQSVLKDYAFYAAAAFGLFFIMKRGR